MLHKQNCLLFIIFINLCQFSFASFSKTKIDSLLSQLNSAKEDTLKVRLLSTLAWEFRTNNPKTSLQFANEAIHLADSINYKKGLAAAYNNLGSVFNIYGDYSKALKNYFIALKISEEINDSILLLNCFNNIGMIYYHSNDDTSAMKFHIKSLIISEKLKDTIRITTSLTWLGNIWYQRGIKEKALTYYKQSLEIGEKGNIMKTSAYLINLNNIGSILTENGDYNDALEYQYKFLRAIRETNDKRSMASAYYNIAENFGKLGNIQNALVYLDSSLTISNELGYKELLKHIYWQFSDNYEIQGENKKSLEYYKLFSAIKDSLINENSLKIIAEMQAKYETEKKEQEIERQNIVIEKRNYQIVAVLTILFMLAIIAVGIILFLRIKGKRKSSELQQKLLRMQMNPHFIFNALLSIQNYMFEKNTDNAAVYLSKFASLVRLILDLSAEEFITLKQEIELLEHYLEMQKLRYENKFTYSIHSDDGIDADFTAIPPMLAQPFIENAIEHGLADIKTGGLITISFIKNEDHILFEIKDNGVGMHHTLEQTRDLKKNHKSRATDITKERLFFLNKGSRKKIKFEIRDLSEFSHDGRTGTKVKFTIPCEYL